jgi:hypothetical protein
MREGSMRLSKYFIRDEHGGIYGYVEGNGANAFHEAMILADDTAKNNPGLLIEVAEDKVWYSTRLTEEGYSANGLHREGHQGRAGELR